MTDLTQYTKLSDGESSTQYQEENDLTFNTIVPTFPGDLGFTENSKKRKLEVQLDHEYNDENKRKAIKLEHLNSINTEENNSQSQATSFYSTQPYDDNNAPVEPTLDNIFIQNHDQYFNDDALTGDESLND